jgi:hypothetical protein
VRRLRDGRPVVQVSIGKPVDLDRFHGAEPTATTLREMTDTIMRAVRDEVAVLRGETPPETFFVPPHRHVDKKR